MYETEANNRVESGDQVPSEVLTDLRDFRKRVLSRTVLPWGEHCTECVWPSCYTSCDLYSPREDGRCRRFVDGMVRLECPGSVTSYLLKIRFKRWGKLWAPGNTDLFTLTEADRLERRDKTFGTALHQLRLPGPVRTFVAGKRYGWKKHAATSRKRPFGVPDHFIVECYNPGKHAIDLSLTMRPSNGVVIPYQKLIRVLPGFLRAEIPSAEITSMLSLSDPFSVELIPNEVPDGTTLFFGLIDFVTRSTQAARLRHVKCVVWDLDNTMWHGTLVEDGAEKLTLKAGIVDVIRELDRRGILNSVASKNNFDEAMAILNSSGIGDLFLYPQISWGPKSEAMKTIAERLNIGIDTLMFVDDSDFELVQVQSTCPGVQVLRAERYCELPGLPECQLPATEESANRRKMYQQEASRESVAENFGGDYLAFLANCDIEMEIDRLSSANLDRVHELTQRTNQMNFSGTRYERKVLEQVAGTSYLDTYVIRCCDRFGSYGIVGFSIVDSREPRMTDLMFSCRVQAKRVEHAFLAYLLKKYFRLGLTTFRATYCKTPRNAVSGRVFQDIGMEQEAEVDGVALLVFHREHAIPDDGIVKVTENILPLMTS